MPTVSSARPNLTTPRAPILLVSAELSAPTEKVAIANGTSTTPVASALYPRAPCR